MKEWREKWIAAWRSHQWCCGKRPGLSRLVLLFASDALQYLCHMQLFKPKNTLSSIRGTHFRSMPEMPYPCEDHGNAVFISRRDHLVIAHRTARLNHCLDSSRGSGINAIAEWKERIAGHH